MKLLELVKTGNIAAVEQQNWSLQELDEPDSAGFTPLMHAAILGDDKMAVLLKEKGANLNLRDAKGRKAVDLAALYGHGKVIINLIEGGCGG